MISKSKKAIHKWTLFIFWVPTCHHAWLVFILEERSSILNLLLNFIISSFLSLFPLLTFSRKIEHSFISGCKIKTFSLHPNPALVLFLCSTTWRLTSPFICAVSFGHWRVSGHLFLHLWRSVTFLLNHHHNEHHAAAETKTPKMKHLVGRWVLL